MSNLLKKSSRPVLALSIILAVFILDQYSKQYVFSYFQENQVPFVKLTDFFNITIAFNKGIAFSLFSRENYSNYIFLSLAIIVTIIISYLLVKSPYKIELISYSLIIGGAIGNIVDRWRNGAVLDFIELHISQYYWPAFNIADSAICIGAFLLLYNIIVNDLGKKNI